MLLETGILFVGYKTFALIPLLVGAAAGLGAGALAAGTGAALAVGLGVGGAAASMTGQYLGGKEAAKAAKKQAEASNDATNRRFAYDVEMWEMKKSQLEARREETIADIELKARNEGKIREWKDAAASRQYGYDLQIRNRQQDSNVAQFKHSADIFYNQVGLNEMTAKAASDSQIVQLQEIQDEQAFDRNDAYLETLVAEGQMRARVVQGRTGVKGEQVTWADYGRQMELLNESLASEGRNTRAALEEIKRDKKSANLVAYANKMLDPGVLPMPLLPMPLPVAEYTLPRAWEEFDFGPKPVHGAMADPNAAYNMQMGNTYAGIASSFGGMMSSVAGAIGSDIELKENIEQVGTSPSGINIYEWNYLGETNRHRGVMAQDLLAKGRQDAVVEMDNGYLGVDYSKLDVQMQPV